MELRGTQFDMIKQKWFSGHSRSFEVIFTKIEKFHVFDDCIFVFIISNYIFTHFFMTQATSNHRK